MFLFFLELFSFDEKLIFFVKERQAVPRTCSEVEPGWRLEDAEELSSEGTSEQVEDNFVEDAHELSEDTSEYAEDNSVEDAEELSEETSEQAED